MGSAARFRPHAFDELFGIDRRIWRVPHAARAYSSAEDDVTVGRGRLLDAAARVYAEMGFRGATTRRIAEEAGVNEITIFRQFGSKEALIEEALRLHAGRLRVPELPPVPRNPAVELSVWCEAVLAYLDDNRTLIRRVMSEMDERPAAVPGVCHGAMQAGQQLRAYVARLIPWGLGPAGPAGAAAGHPATANGAAGAAGVPGGEADVEAAISMLMSALFADAMGREVMPAMYPAPRDAAAAAYVGVFLRALGLAPPRRRSDVPSLPRAAARSA